MSQKRKLNTRKALRGKATTVEEPRASYRLSKRWQRHDQEMRRNTEGCKPDFENLP